mgnify:CR=1 FL=1
MKIGVIIIATNKYIKFVPSLYKSICDNFIPEYEIKTFVLTDQSEIPEGVVKIPFDHRPWLF